MSSVTYIYRPHPDWEAFLEEEARKDAQLAAIRGTDSQTGAGESLPHWTEVLEYHPIRLDLVVGEAA
jgi:hypothetical protein